jgi:lysophospholipase L1-like esterase
VPPALPPPVAGPAASPLIQTLKSYLDAHAQANVALPAIAAAPPAITWVAPLVVSSTAATTLPGGQLLPVGSTPLGGPLPDRWTASLPGGPALDGIPCRVLARNYSCKGEARAGASPSVIRVTTDAPTIEVAGVVVDTPGNWVAVSLIVDGARVDATVLGGATREAGGGWVTGTLSIAFGNRAMRDIWLQTSLNVAYLKVGAADLVQPLPLRSEPQMTVIGDSYLKSTAASYCGDGPIALEIAARLGIRDVAVDSVSGTGYWNSGVDWGNLSDRLPAQVADNSTLYVVMAGLNDYVDVIAPPQQVWPTQQTYEDAVTGYFSNLRAAQPDALIVATAPFCPVACLSDASYVANPGTNGSGLGDFLYKAQIQKRAVHAIAGPWVYVDVLMGGGWLNSSGASGDITNLQWFTGGHAPPGTTATNKPGDPHGGGGGGFGGVASVPVVTGGSFQQAPQVVATGGSGSGLLLATVLDSSGQLAAIKIIAPGAGYTPGAGLPTLSIDSTYQLVPPVLGTPQLMQGIAADGAYPLPSFAPSTAADLNNIYSLLLPDTMHPSPLGVNYLSSRLAQNIRDAVMAF